MSEFWSTQEESNDDWSVPLQFHALWAECVPVRGGIDRIKLEKLLSRAGLDNDEISKTLKLNAPSPVVDEVQFYNALREAALQQDPHLDISDGTLQPLSLAPIEEQQETESIPDSAEELLYDVANSRPISIELKEGREGHWGFKHFVFRISGTFQAEPIMVQRRYSDFTWLLDTLIKRYTFRALPLLPPKKAGINGYFLSGDRAQFLERRMLGLTRFLNLLVAHPIVSRDEAVVKFLTVNSPLEVLKSQMEVPKIHTEDELSNLKASPAFIIDWKEEAWREWVDGINASNDIALLQVSELAKLVARRVWRLQAQAADACTFTMGFESLNKCLSQLYPDNCDNIPQIAAGATAVAKFGETCHGEYLKAAESLKSGPLEDLKYYRDMLLSTKDLLRRFRVHGGNTVGQLEKRIEKARAKLRVLPSEDSAQKLEQDIQDWENSIKFQTNRMWLIRQTVTKELHMVQSSQSQLSRLIRALATTYTDEVNTIKSGVSTFYDSVSDLPLHS